MALSVAVGVAFRRLFSVDPDASLPGAVGGLEGWFFSPLGNSPPFVVAVSLLLAYMRFPQFRASLREAPEFKAVVVFGALSILLFGWAHHVSAYFLLLPSLSFFLLALSAGIAGRGGLRAASVPALFLLFAFPLPGVLVNHWVFPLQKFAAIGSGWILDVAGMEVAQLGDRVFTQSHIFQVIESCSGLRAMETLTLTAVLYCQLFPRAWRHAVLIVVAAPLIGLGINLLRVLSIILNPYATISEVHTTQGIVMIVAGVFLLAGWDVLLTRFLPASWKSRRRRTRSPEAAARGPGWMGGLVPALGAALALVLLGETIPRWEPMNIVERPSLLQLGRRADLGSATGLRIDDQFLGSVGFAERNWLEFDFEGHSVRLFVGIDERLNPSRSMLSEKTQLLRTATEKISYEKIEIPEARIAIDRVVTKDPEGLRLSYHWVRNAASFSEELARASFALDRGFARRPHPAVVVHASLALQSTQAPALEEADQVLRRFLRKVEPALKSYGAI